MSHASHEWAQLLAGRNFERFAPAAIAAPEGPAWNFILGKAIDAGVESFVFKAARAGEPIVLAVNDSHRLTDTRSAIEAICCICEENRLEAKFRLLVAAGSHVFSDAEKAAHESAIVGDRARWIVERDWHTARDEAQQAAAGGVRVHRWLAGCRHALAIGSLEPHYFAGMTGAHKTLTAGLLHYDDLAANHKLAMGPEPAPLRLDGNPVYEGLAAMLRAMEQEGRKFFAINEWMADGRVVDCIAGHPLGILAEALARTREMYSARIERPFDWIVSVVEPPLDRDLYQADKGIKNIEAAVRDGGIIVIDAKCEHGVGLDRFVQLLRRAGDYAGCVGLIEEEGYRLGDHKAARLRALTDARGVRLGAVAQGLKEEDAQAAGIRLFASRADAAVWVEAELGADARGALVEDAGNFCLGYH